MAQIEFDGYTDAFNVAGEVNTLTYGSYVHTEVIDISKDWRILIKWTTSGANCALFTGNWEVTPSLETMGPQIELETKSLQLTPGSSPIDYEMDFMISANSITEGVYRLVIMITYLDSAGKPGPIVGYSDSLVLQLYRSDVSPSEISDSELILRADKIKVLNALESSNSPWLSIVEISKETALDTEEVKKILLLISEHVMEEKGPNTVVTSRFATIARIQRELRSKDKDLDVYTAAQNAMSAGRRIESDSSEAYERIVGSTTSVLAQLQLNFDQARNQADNQFKLSMIAGGVGLLLITAAAVTLIMGYTSTAVVSTLSSIVFDSMAIFFFRVSKEANERVDNITKKLDETREIYALVAIVDTINEKEQRNELKSEIINKALSKQITSG